MTMSRTAQGAASAAPAVRPEEGLAKGEQWLAEARDDIEAVTTPEEALGLLDRIAAAEAILRLEERSHDFERRWRAVALEAQRRYGQILGAAKTGRPKNVSGTYVPPAERVAKSQARKVAAVPQELFEEYIEEAEQPSREGLLREARKRSGAEPRKRDRRPPKEPADREGLADDPAVLRWYMDKRRRGWTRDRMGAAAEAGTNGWPVEAQTIASGTATALAAVARALERRAGEEGAARGSRRAASLKAGRRKAKRNGGSTVFWEVAEQATACISYLEQIRPDHLELSEYDLDFIGLFLDDLFSLHDWSGRLIGSVQTRLGEQGVREKIEKLRAVTVERGATLGEEENAQRAAALLERNLKRRIA